MSRLTVEVTLSQSAMKAAALAGKPAAKVQRFIDDAPVASLVETALSLGARIADDGNIAVAVGSFRDSLREAAIAQNDRFRYADVASIEIERRPESVFEALGELALLRQRHVDAWAEMIHDEEMKTRRSYEEWLDEEEPTAAEPGGPPPSLDSPPPDLVERVAARVAAREAAKDERVAHQQRERELEIAAVDAYLAGGARPAGAESFAFSQQSRIAIHDAVLEEQRLRALVLRYGSQIDVERVEALDTGLGYLDRDRALEIVRDAVLIVGGTTELTPFVPLTERDIARYCDRDCDWSEESYLIDDEPTLSAEEWSALKATRARLAAAGLPDGNLHLHLGQCDGRRCPEWPARRLGVLVEAEVDGVKIAREYAVDEQE